MRGSVRSRRISCNLGEVSAAASVSRTSRTSREGEPAGPGFWPISGKDTPFLDWHILLSPYCSEPIRKSRQALLQELTHTQVYIDRLLKREDRGSTIKRPTFAAADWEGLTEEIAAQLERVASDGPAETLARVERWVKAYLAPEARQALRRTLAQRRYAAKQKLKTIPLSEATHSRLASYAAKEGLTLDEAIEALLARSEPSL